MCVTLFGMVGWVGLVVASKHMLLPIYLSHLSSIDTEATINYLCLHDVLLEDLNINGMY
jgi:hypothetical protein